MKYAVIYTENIHHEGDERSRTNPGHGYPAWTETVEKIRTFKSEQELLKWVDSQGAYSYRKYTAIQYEELNIVQTTSIKVKK